MKFNTNRAEFSVKCYQLAPRLSDAAQAHTDGLIARQGAIASAWKAFNAASPPADKAAFKTAWMAARAKSLEGAGLDPIFK